MTVSSVPATDHAPRVQSRTLADHSVPIGREEDWRFTPMARLRGLASASAPLTEAVDVTWTTSAGASVEWVALSDPRVGEAYLPSDIVSARALNSVSRALLVTLASEQQPIVHVEIVGTGLAAAAHVIVEAQPFAEGVVVLHHRGDAVFAGNVEIRVGNGARITVVSVQDWDPAAVHVGEHHASLGRDAGLVLAHISLGGDLVRLKPTVRYLAPGGDAELLGLFFADAGQHLEHRIFVDHDTPHCRSSVVYKGALQGDGARSVWIGDVLVRAEAIGTDTYEVNRNLLLSEGARADSVPNLELETGEIVGAGHASATGRFDEEQLFYLRSRGIPEDLARVLVVRGFFADILQRLHVQDVRDMVMARVDARLGVTDPGFEEEEQ